MRYLEIRIDENLNLKAHLHDLASKLNRANAVLAKLRHFANSKTLRCTYFAIFHPYLSCVCIVWDLHRIMKFAPFNAQNTPLFKNCKVC